MVSIITSLHQISVWKLWNPQSLVSQSGNSDTGQVVLSLQFLKNFVLYLQDLRSIGRLNLVKPFLLDP